MIVNKLYIGYSHLVILAKLWRIQATHTDQWVCRHFFKYWQTVVNLIDEDYVCFIQCVDVHFGIPSSHSAMMALQGFSLWLAMVLTRQAPLHQTTCKMTTLKRFAPPKPGLLSACHAVFMHGHVERELSLRTVSQPSTLNLKQCGLQT